MGRIPVAFLALFLGFNSHSALAENFDIKTMAKNDLLGNTIEINRPVALLSGIPHCNNVDGDIAFNSDCRKTEAQFMLKMSYNSCPNCFNVEAMAEPIKVSVEDVPLKLTITQAVTSKPIPLTHSLFSEEIVSLVAEDQRGRTFEFLAYELPRFNSRYRLNREEEKLKLILDKYKSDPVITQQFCFLPGTFTNTEIRSNIQRLLHDFDINEDVKTRYTSCGDTQGVTFTTKNLNAFMTFNYFRANWNISGTWL